MSFWYIAPIFCFVFAPKFFFPNSGGCLYSKGALRMEVSRKISKKIHFYTLYSHLFILNQIHNLFQESEEFASVWQQLL
jgi:hypothetical protein